MRNTYVRASKHGIVDKERRKMLNLIREWGFSICNGNVEGEISYRL